MGYPSLSPEKAHIDVVTLADGRRKTVVPVRTSALFRTSGREDEKALTECGPSDAHRGRVAGAPGCLDPQFIPTILDTKPIRAHNFMPGGVERGHR